MIVDRNVGGGGKHPTHLSQPRLPAGLPQIKLSEVNGISKSLIETKHLGKYDELNVYHLAIIKTYWFIVNEVTHIN